jgi:hypothetical protein
VKSKQPTFVDGILSESNGDLGMGGDFLREFNSLRNELLNRQYLTNKATPLGFLGCEMLARKNHLHSFAFADGAGKSLSATSPGYSADRYLRLPEFGLITRVDNVAHHGQFATTAKLKIMSLY